MTELVLLCLTLATDAPLIEANPFTTTIQHCMDQANTNRKVADSTQQVAVLTMSTIAKMLADWIGRSLHPWFQTSNQRQPHRHRRIPKRLFSMLKLLHDNTQRQQVCKHMARQYSKNGRTSG